MKLHEELEAVRRETVLPVDRETAWERVRDLEWLGEDCEVLEEEAPSRLTLRWAGDERTIVDVALDDAEDGTRITVVELPVRALRAVGAEIATAAARGPQMVA